MIARVTYRDIGDSRFEHGHILHLTEIEGGQTDYIQTAKEMCYTRFGAYPHTILVFRNVGDDMPVDVYHSR